MDGLKTKLLILNKSLTWKQGNKYLLQEEESLNMSSYKTKQKKNTKKKHKHKRNKQLRIFCYARTILLPVQSKNIIFSHYTVTKKLGEYEKYTHNG